jgi:hypothetical protein
MFFRYDIRKVQGDQEGLKLKVTHQVLGYADDVNLLGDNISTIKKNTETLIDVTEKCDMEVNRDITKYVLLSRQ